MPKRRSNFRIIVTVGLAFGLVFVLLASAEWLRLQALLSGVQAHSESLGTSLKEPSEWLANPAQLRDDLAHLEDDLKAIKRETAFLMPVVQRIPGVQKRVQGLSEALDIGLSLVKTGHTILLAGDALAQVSTGGRLALLDSDASAERLLEALTSASPYFAQADLQLGQIQGDLDRLQRQPLAPAVRTQVDQARHITNELQPLLKFAEVAPQLASELLAMDGPRAYLVLAQNTYEIRATGGFISGAWYVEVDHGRLKTLEFYDSGKVDDLTQRYPPPPEPMFKYMRASIWLFRDANWYTNFPTSAQMAQRLFAIGQGKSVDGVIAIDELALQAMVGAVGPLTLPGFGETIDRDNILLNLEQGLLAMSDTQTLSEPLAPRKLFIKELFEAILTRAQSGLTLRETGRLLSIIRKGLDEKHLVMYSQHDGIQQLLRTSNWDGAVQEGTSDFLLVVDSNIGYNKVNHQISEEIEYTVDLRNPDKPKAEARITYLNKSTQDVFGCFQQATRASYAEWKEGCYWDYLRIYVPGKSRLIGATYYPLPKESLLRWFANLDDRNDPSPQPPEGGKWAYGNFFVVRPGETGTVSFQYELPKDIASVTPEGLYYSLLVQKQAGTIAIPVRITVVPPEGSELVRSNRTVTRSEGVMQIESNLKVDRVFELLFRAREQPFR